MLIFIEVTKERNISQNVCGQKFFYFYEETQLNKQNNVF